MGSYHEPMPYMLLIQEPVGQRATRTRAEGEAVHDRMVRFAAEWATVAVGETAPCYL